jgi:hypothetical protein
MEHIRGIKIQEAISLWREIDPSVKNKSYNALKNKIRRAAEKGIIDTTWFSGYSHKLYKNIDVVKFAKSQMKSEPVTNCNQTEQPTSDCSQLPKLTAEVFDRPDCPAWARYAAVHANGIAFFYENEPSFGVGKLKGTWYVDDGEFCRVDTTLYFDPSDWQNSLIERPAKLPDWCKPGEWVYLSNAKYYKIEKVDSYGIILADGTVIKTDDIHAEAVSARLRPYNAEEVPVLPFEVRSVEYNFRTTLVLCNGVKVLLSGVITMLTMEELAQEFTFADGSPCGVLEHLENWEWVK